MNVMRFEEVCERSESIFMNVWVGADSVCGVMCL